MEEQIKFIVYVRGLKRLPKNLKNAGLEFKFTLHAPREPKEITREDKDKVTIQEWEENSLPKSHTCTFELD